VEGTIVHAQSEEAVESRSDHAYVVAWKRQNTVSIEADRSCRANSARIGMLLLEAIRLNDEQHQH